MELTERGTFSAAVGEPGMSVPYVAVHWNIIMKYFSDVAFFV